MTTSETLVKTIRTDDILEFEKWIKYMKENGIKFKGKLGSRNHKWDCEMELECSEDEAERIKSEIGYYYDEELV